MDVPLVPYDGRRARCCSFVESKLLGVSSLDFPEEGQEFTRVDDVEVVLLISLEDGAGFAWMGAGTTPPDFLGEVPESAGFWDGVGLLLGPLVEASAVVGLRVGLALSDPFEEVPEGDEVEDVVSLPGTLEEGPVGVWGIPSLDPLGEVLEGFEL